MKMICPKVSVISDFCGEVDENCALLGYYAASCVNSLRMLRATYGSNLEASRIWILDPEDIACI